MRSIVQTKLRTEFPDNSFQHALNNSHRPCIHFTETAFLRALLGDASRTSTPRKTQSNLRQIEAIPGTSRNFYNSGKVSQVVPLTNGGNTPITLHSITPSPRMPASPPFPHPPPTRCKPDGESPPMCLARILMRPGDASRRACPGPGQPL